MPGLPAFLQRLRATYRGRASFRWAVDLGLFALIVTGVGLWQTRAHVHGGAVPAFELPLLSGEKLSSGVLAGKPSVLVFWAPWCGVCESESRNVGWAKKLAGERANVFSIATAYQTVDQVTAYATRNNVDYPVALDEGGLAEALKVTSFPTAYFLDERGHIKGSTVGYTTTLGFLLRALW